MSTKSRRSDERNAFMRCYEADGISDMRITAPWSMISYDSGCALSGVGHGHLFAAC